MTLTHTHPKYRSDIDGLRAVAVLSVVGFHAFPSLIPGGYIGVDIFFVISGFLISSIIFQSLEQGNFSLSDFYVRRIKRIFPALALVLVSCAVLGWFTLLAAEYAQLGKHIVAGASFISNFALLEESGYFDVSSDIKPLLHLWSLGIEEQFYILWPALAWAMWRYKGSIFIILLCAIALSFSLNIANIHSDQASTFYLPQTRVWELWIGSLVAWASLYRKNYLNRLTIKQNTVLSFLGFALILCGLYFLNKQTIFPGAWALFPSLGTALIIIAGEDALFNKIFLSIKPAVWFGLISFPLYLWHWPLLSFAHILENETPSRTLRLGAMILAIILAWLTFKLLERPIRLSTASKTITPTLVVIMTAIAATGFFIYKHDGLSTRSIVQNNIDPRQSANYSSFPSEPCFQNLDPSPINKFCTKYSPLNPTKTIVLWGDSSTGAWLPVFQKIGYEHDFSIINISFPSCPPILNARKTRFDFPESRAYCSDGKIQSDVLEYIRQIKPDAIIVIAAWNSYSAVSKREFLTDIANTSADSASTVKVLETQLPQTFHALSIIAPTIIFKSWPILPLMPSNRNVEFWGNPKKVVSVSKTEFNADNSQINMIFDRLPDQNIIFYDPSNKILQHDQYVSVKNGVNLYADKYHITPQGSLLFKEEIEELLDSLVITTEKSSDLR